MALLALLLLGSMVQVYARYAPYRVPDYRIHYVEHVAPPEEPRVDAPAQKLKEGIDPNVAPAEDLELLPGIGPGLALRIVKERQLNGPFTDGSDLTRVRGIGARLVERFESHLRFP
jgi:competence ComEA-like helix-hairpin-helix protein